MGPKKDADRITQAEIRKAVARSGYLLEQRVKNLIERFGYFVETNPAYPDPHTGVSREYDISAISARRVSRKWEDIVFPVILCECENNAQPVVFFETQSPISFLHHEQVKCSGIPIKFWDGQGYTSLSDFLKFEKFHHYCTGSWATQYCTFARKNPKEPWVARHADEQHQTFAGLMNATEAAIAEHYSNWALPRKGEREQANIQIYYPLLVLQGPIYLARETAAGITLRPARHVQFRKEVWSKDHHDEYQIDVVHESFVRGYLRLIDRETDELVKRLRRHKREVRSSIDRIISHARRFRKKIPPWRDLFEL